MSYGTVCLRCRLYVVEAAQLAQRDAKFHCTCSEPVLSENAVTPDDPADAQRYPDVCSDALERQRVKAEQARAFRRSQR